ncbi:DUF4194 domain-containing protein [Oceanobacter antarcticus]|uniref:DUF4194 domain-containing protein n=1 Tax=Oceanobacter antarcticus TaxID=3133425 RepID=A0ABW8NP23_9GAMM
MTSIFDEPTAQPPEKPPHLSEKSSENNHAEGSIPQVIAPDVGVAGVGRTDRRLRDTAQQLLNTGLLEQTLKPNVYRVAVVNLEAINAILEPLDLQAQVDDIRGLVFLKVVAAEKTEEQDDWSHPLVRKQRLTLEQSLLVAILRQYFVNYEQDSGVGAADAVVAIDELVPQLQLYLGDSGSESKERNRMITLLDQLKGHGLVTAPDSHDRVTIRPVIAHLANPENLQALLNGLREQADGQPDDSAREE